MGRVFLWCYLAACSNCRQQRRAPTDRAQLDRQVRPRGRSLSKTNRFIVIRQRTELSCAQRMAWLWQPYKWMPLGCGRHRVPPQRTASFTCLQALTATDIQRDAAAQIAESGVDHVYRSTRLLAAIGTQGAHPEHCERDLHKLVARECALSVVVRLLKPCWWAYDRSNESCFEQPSVAVAASAVRTCTSWRWTSSHKTASSRRKLLRR